MEEVLRTTGHRDNSEAKVHFGYEAEHYELSVAIGARRLFPALRARPSARSAAASPVASRSPTAPAAAPGTWGMGDVATLVTFN